MTGLPPTVLRIEGSTSIVSRILFIGIAYVSSSTLISKAWIIAMLMGSLSINVVPLPTSVWTEIEPFIDFTTSFTTSIPTPLPDTSVTLSAVLNPGRNIKLIASSSLRFAASSGVIRPLSTAFLFTFSGSIPLPSSLTIITTWFFSLFAISSTLPALGLPSFTLSSGGSIP
ncbi:170aa long hypothetical protein [Pyrococcus horikoshii OT3]|uniref:Uncharacterized protein n=1 Tax=Pyrococcus horikoshii (strain ATCC 700860 / DSM 12428 / JCM 9974 / NBRC 100139 / OT-3) TaxID=70601 RepID=O73976_PYRHO|nr:170aa long hypothetical protein [Pyrococcus horikoshii OT3]